MNSSRLVLGTVQMGLDYGVANQRGRVPPDEARAILQIGRANGIDWLDTAAAYGESEATLGQLGMKDWKVVTKLRAAPADCIDVEAWVREEVAASLRRLGVESVDGLLAHRPDQFLGRMGESIYASLKRLQEEGKVHRIGVSIYEPDDLEPLVSHFDFEMVQAPFNLLDRRMVNSGWLDRCRARGMLVHVRSIFLQGALLLKSADRRKRFSRWVSLWDRYEDWLRTSELTPVEACLRFALLDNRIDGAVVGVDSPSQMQELIEVANNCFSIQPPDFSTTDLDLINPARWNKL